MAAFTRFSDLTQPISIYIEGDGLAWITRTQVSNDPTPRTPIGLKLAALDPAPNVAYLARPCQYAGVGSNPSCIPALWSDARFSEQVILAIDQAIDAIVPPNHGPIHLVGYSGGAAVALLVTARRSDVASIRTVAGNVDNGAVIALHQVSSMPISLDPADVAPVLVTIPQVHYTGKADETIPPVVAEGYAQKAGSHRCITLREVPEATHKTGWLRIWPEVVKDMPECRR